MSRSRTPTDPGLLEADPRFPFPFTDTPTACRTHPEWFSHERTSTRAAEKDIAKAKLACSGCPIVADCLKWALANPALTPVGVWAATTPRQRPELRRRLTERLGPDWPSVVTQRDQAAKRRTTAELAAIRTWARSNGHQVADRGLPAQTVLDAYDAAHPTTMAKAS
jgi:transcription factor WhiB/Lsr2 protein